MKRSAQRQNRTADTGIFKPPHSAVNSEGTDQNRSSLAWIWIKGDLVEVTAGLSAGLKGRVVERATMLFGDLPVYVVDLGGLLSRRAIRGDYLRSAS